MTAPKPQKMIFIQACPPALDDGEYRIRVDHDVDLAAKGRKIPEKIQTFSVKGPRYSMDPATVDSAFPPANNAGFYANCLPHVVMTRKTLPWERHLFPGKTATRVEAGPAPADVHPWLAILTFDSAEAPALEKRTAKEIQTPGPNIVSGGFAPDIEAGESPDTPCLTIDLPSATFNAIVPGQTELPFLSHARHVDMTHKKTDQSNDGDYAVTVGSRFPLASHTGEKNISHLVSLEGLGDYLPGGSQEISDDKVSVRLISLYAWEYAVIAEKFDFRKLMTDLSPGKTFKLPVPEKAGPDLTFAFNQGYTPMTHHVRDGEQSFSWYRGPLVPLFLEEQKSGPAKNADALYRYDPGTGLFDISLAAAWQIGRLLALKNKGVALALFQWRRRNNQTAAFRNMRARLARQLQGILSHDPNHDPIQDQFIGDTLVRGLALDYLSRDLGKKLKPDSGKGKGFMGTPADPWGLVKDQKEYPGLVSLEALEKIASEGGDLAANIVKTAMGEK